MKMIKSSLFLLLCAGFWWGGSTQRAMACFDIIPKIHQVTCYYDSLGFQEFAVRVGSLRTLANAPGDWCTCALRTSSPLFSMIRYIAVVDSGTNHRTDGFAPWYHWPPASSAWDSVYQVTWDGFIGQIEGLGTTAGQPVELIIRAQFPVGYAVGPLMSDLVPTIVGWGNWNDSLQKVEANRWWLDWPMDTDLVYVPILNPGTFFPQFDQELAYTGMADALLAAQLRIYPNPVQSILHLEIDHPAPQFRSVGIYDALGRAVVPALSATTNAVALDVSALVPGSYFVRIALARGVVTKRFLKG